MALTVLASAALALVVGGSEVDATPLYMARAGRTCDNCHTDPTGWKNPNLLKRKCSLSCINCHVNPTGGGLRTVSGRFYGQATLPMALATHRPYKDWNRHLAGFLRSKERKNRFPDPAFGKPIGGSSDMALDEKRYAGLRADPFVLFGFDARFALWLPEGRPLFFPMQYDVDLMVHPVRYVSAYVSAGVLGKEQGIVETFGVGCRPEDPTASCFSRARSTPFMVKDAFLMLHQLPANGYLRVGRFIPPFGLMHDDHTIPTRREFELDQGLLHSRVTGGELGLVANYPYFHLAAFRPSPRPRFINAQDPLSPDALPPFFGVGSFGMATSFGWRDLGWQLGLSGMMRLRELNNGGDTYSGVVSIGFNPWFYVDWLPLTYLGEIAFGMRQRQGSGARTGQLAMMHELDYLAFNGVNFRVRYDFSDGDTEIRDDQYHRFIFGTDLIFIPSVALTAQFRTRVNAGDRAATSVDGIFFLHGWY